MQQWRMTIGFLGGLVWVVIINNLELVQKLQSQVINDIAIGYLLGVVTTFFSMYVWRVSPIHCFKDFVLSETGLERAFAGFIFIFLSVIALSGWSMPVLLSLHWVFNLGFAIGAAVVSLGIFPSIDYFDKPQRA